MSRSLEIDCLRVVTLLVGIAAGGGGCGSVSPAAPDAGGTGGGGSGSGGAGMVDAGPEVAPLTVDQACGQVARAICDALKSCAPPLLRGIYGDEATCIARGLLACTTDQNAPGTNRTLTEITMCADAVADATCPDLVASKFPSVCNVKPGMRPNGSACGSDWQCQSTYCRKMGQCGVCGPRAGLAEACTVNNGCQEGMVCANAKCAVPGDVAAPCDANRPCRSDLYCAVPPDMSTGGTCAMKVGAAGMCDRGDQACDLSKGVSCNWITKVCDPVNVADRGDACGIVNGVPTLCVGLNPCRGISILTLQFTGVCASPAGDGEPCGAASNGTNCVPPSECVMDICRLPNVAACN
jgi:hypothetical protein